MINLFKVAIVCMIFVEYQLLQQQQIVAQSLNNNAAGTGSMMRNSNEVNFCGSPSPINTSH
jgi:hypothetical protein